ncbi:hypothetical protein BRADI_2g46043v3 [Brachypodium distachyon]|uniref:Uncharacterized protein n=1 Tax=Brachypodium distachyon TaxID=15368 RepID=A0A0Q3KDK1_BRADI|nr:hypothetical protein BRADI_2g46043v3 [Brachypodium distachyon]
MTAEKYMSYCHRRIHSLLCYSIEQSSYSDQNQKHSKQRKITSPYFFTGTKRAARPQGRRLVRRGEPAREEDRRRMGGGRR